MTSEPAGFRRSLGVADSWQQDLLQQLRADIQQKSKRKLEFNKLSVSLVHEIQSIASLISANPAAEHTLPTNTLTKDFAAEINGRSTKLRSSIASEASHIQNYATKAEKDKFETWFDNYVVDTIERVDALMPSEPGKESEHLHRLERFVTSGYFTGSSLMVILANTIWMSFDGDFQLRVLLDPEHGHAEAQAWRHTVSMSFVAFFAVELIFKAVCLRKSFIIGEDWKWNLYDLVLVASSIPEFFEVNANMSFLRILRVLKITKAFRLMRVVKFLGSLREILYSFIQTQISLFWSFLAILLVTYMFSLLFMQQLSLLLENGYAPSDEVVEGLLSTGQSMVTLFSLISGGQDWLDFMEGFHGSDLLSLLSKCTIVLYIFFMLFGLVNVIIGVFAARALAASSSDEYLLALKQEDEYNSVIKQALKVFHDIGVKGGGSLTREQFKQYVKSPKSSALRAMPGLSIIRFDIEGIWKVMLACSKADNNTVDLPAFVLALLRFSGESSAEIVMMAMTIEHIDMRLCMIFETLEHHSQAGDEQPSSHEGSGQGTEELLTPFPSLSPNLLYPPDDEVPEEGGGSQRMPSSPPPCK